MSAQSSWFELLDLDDSISTPCSISRREILDLDLNPRSRDPMDFCEPHTEMSIMKVKESRASSAAVLPFSSAAPDCEMPRGFRAWRVIQHGAQASLPYSQVSEWRLCQRSFKWHPHLTSNPILHNGPLLNRILPSTATFQRRRVHDIMAGNLRTDWNYDNRRTHNCEPEAPDRRAGNGSLWPPGGGGLRPPAALTPAALTSALGRPCRPRC